MSRNRVERRCPSIRRKGLSCWPAPGGHGPCQPLALPLLGSDNNSVAGGSSSPGLPLPPAAAYRSTPAAASSSSCRSLVFLLPSLIRCLSAAASYCFNPLLLHAAATQPKVIHAAATPTEAMEGTSNSRNDSLVWTDAQLEYLINLLVQQSRLPGMKSGGNLKPKAYKAIEQRMIEQFGPGFTIEKIKNKLKITKANYNICKQILATSGFGWDPTNKCVEVENQVWADYIERFPQRRKFKGGQKWKHYDELHEVYGSSTATGRTARNCDSFMMNEECESNQAPETPATQTSDFGINIEENISYTQMLNGDSPTPSPTHVQQESQPTASDSRAKHGEEEGEGEKGLSSVSCNGIITCGSVKCCCRFSLC
ncbi:hypothetical protein EJ110_NYTH35728 [Nymphaea thermarum]|nr:hypothetical protein EJ110_NYTH35728 [Nymphaea thermarum]